MRIGILLLKLLRVKQWIKNGFVLVPLVFSPQFTRIDAITKAGAAFFTFCLVSSFIYIINDIIDREADAKHPKKRHRPLASGAVSIPSAIFMDILCLTGTGALLVYLDVGKVTVTIVSYIITNLLYSWKLKHIPLLDVFCIAFGFVLRVYAGAYAVDTFVSSYLFMVMMFISLFLAFGKRKAEMANAGWETRKSLDSYSGTTIDRYLTILADAVIISYALYTLDSDTLARFGNRLVYSVVFVVYGIFRYMAELDKSSDYDDPTDNLYKDKVLIAVCVMYAGYVTLIAAGVIICYSYSAA
jgi:4-hydroxybenzoate polyprenyltransferase